MLTDLHSVFTLLRAVTPDSINMPSVVVFPVVQSLSSLCAAFDPSLSEYQTTIEAVAETWAPTNVADEARVTKMRHVLGIVNTSLDAAAAFAGKGDSKEHVFLQWVMDIRDHGNVVYTKYADSVLKTVDDEAVLLVKDVTSAVSPVERPWLKEIFKSTLTWKKEKDLAFASILKDVLFLQTVEKAEAGLTQACFPIPFYIAQ